MQSAYWFAFGVSERRRFPATILCLLAPPDTLPTQLFENFAIGVSVCCSVVLRSGTRTEPASFAHLLLPVIRRLHQWICQRIRSHRDGLSQTGLSIINLVIVNLRCTLV